MRLLKATEAARRGLFAGIVGATVAGAASHLSAQVIQPGVLVPRMTSISNPTQSYALYVPSRYDTTRVWPVLFLMDPRGRALGPMNSFRPVAEKYGYIVISSYNTVSDGPIAPNVVAINAMIADVRATMRADSRRYYMVGFSGTARLAWDFASQLNGPVAGIFGAGASGMTLNGDTLPIRPALAFFGTAGVRDFNYEEMRAYEATLRVSGVPHRVRYFDGAHQWPPDSLAEQGIEYFQLRAMKRGFIPTDSEFIRRQYTADSTRARAAEQAKHMEEALNRWREIEREYSFARIAQDEVIRLSENGRTIQEIEKRQHAADEYLENRARLAAWLQRSKTLAGIDIKVAAKELHLDMLRKAATNKRDQIAAESAQRCLQDILAQLSFYYPREALQNGDRQRALAYLDLAEYVSPGSTLNSPLRAEASH